MDTTRLPPDFKDFLRLLTEHQVDYLLIGGYAVGHFGYVRATADMDVWIARETTNAQRLVSALKAFGFDVPDLDVELFLAENRIVRMGVPPLRIEIHTDISGVEFSDCDARRVDSAVDGTPVTILSLDDLKSNKQASNRAKDLADPDNRP